jgi:hypothetical protein
MKRKHIRRGIGIVKILKLHADLGRRVLSFRLAIEVGQRARAKKDSLMLTELPNPVSMKLSEAAY